MESAYGIGVQNRYALFLDGEDDSVDPYAQLTNAADTEPKAKATATAAGGKPGPKTTTGVPAKPTQKPTPGALSESKANVVANQKDAAGRSQNRSRSGNQQNQRPVRGDQENRTQRSPRTNNAFNQQPFEAQGQDGELKPTGGRDFRNDKDGRRNGFGPRDSRDSRDGGRGGPRGRGGDRGGARFGGKRDFNRHSGSDKTGIKATEKREGAGAHNWGKSVDDFTAPPEDEQANGEQPAETAVEGAEVDPAATGEEKTGVEGEEPKSDEPLLKTLDEYKREREEKRMHTQFNTRKANEGEDKSKWKKTFVLKKKEKTDEEEVEYEEIEVEEDPNKRRNRKILDIEVNFRPSDEGREFVRRGRGGPGGRGRGGPRGGGERGDRGGDRGGERGGDRGGDREDRGDRRSAGGPPSGEPRPPREPRTPREGGNGRPSGGRGGRGQQQGGRSFQSAPKFDDLNDFPSL